LQNLGAVLVAGLAVGVVGAARWDGSAALWGLLVWSVLVTSVLAGFALPLAGVVLARRAAA
jgi:hypothetical protein